MILIKIDLLTHCGMAFPLPSLKIDPVFYISSVLSKRRNDRITEAVAWPKGESKDNKIYQTIWSQVSPEQGYSICLGKPGKETESKRVNENDMTPSIFYDGKRVDISGSFAEIFEAIEDLIADDKEVAAIMGGLLFRSAYMLDHVEIELGKWRYSSPKEAIAYMRDKNIAIYNLPPDVFLAYLDAIGWNEDVKYKTLGYDVTGKQKNIGRLNNILTYVNIFSVLMHAKKVAHIFATFSSSRGVSAITLSHAREAFPFLEIPMSSRPVKIKEMAEI